MEILELKINNNVVTLIDSPEGLENTQIKFNRDDKYNGMLIELDIKLKFYCASGKEEIDAEYERAFIDGIGEITIQEECSGEIITATFLLDFKKYRSTLDYTEIGLTEKNATNNFKNNLTNDVELQGSEPFHIRNLKLKYDYRHSKIKITEKGPYTILRPNNSYGPIDLDLWLIPEAEVDYNRLEDGYNMNGDIAIMEEDGNSFIVPTTLLYGTSYINGTVDLPSVEGQAIFENVLEDGVVFIKSEGSTGFELSIKKGRTNLSYYRTIENIVIGESYNSPRIVLTGYLNSNQSLNGPFYNMIDINTIGDYNYSHPNQTQIVDYNLFPSMSSGIPIKKGESLWLVTSLKFYGKLWSSTIVIDGVTMPSGTQATWLSYEEIDLKVNRSLEIEFITNENASDVINNENDAIIYGTEVDAFKGVDIAPQIFNGLNKSLFETNCYSDFWITNGERIRRKQKQKTLLVKPETFFEELEKILSCGLGIFYNSNVATLELQPIEFFYTDNISKVIDIDNIDDIIIEPTLNMYYNNIEVGYSENKNTELDLHNRNSYNIKTKGKSIFTKVTDWIGSKYIIKKALNLGTEEVVKDYDSSIFILSGASSNGVNYTLSQTSGFASDGITEVPAEPNGINRKYASVYNLFRHFRKWGFGLWKSYTTLENNSIFDKTLSWNNNCGLPTSSLESHKTIIATNYKNKSMIPEYISFNVVMNIVEFWQMRNFWYDLIQVNAPNKTYLGNIVSAEYTDGVVNFKLIRRQL